MNRSASLAALGLILGTAAYLGTQPKSKPKQTPTNIKPKQSSSTPASKPANLGPSKPVPEGAGKLQVAFMLAASGGEKFALSMGALGGVDGLTEKAKAMATDLIPTLNKGPIPKIITKQGYLKSFKDVDNGYLVTVAYGAQFHKGAVNGPVRKEALDYITKVLKANKDFGSRVTKVQAAKV